MVVQFGKLRFNDNRIRPYEFSRRIIHNWYQDECEIFTVYGMPEGVGKSACVNSVIADVKGWQACQDKDKVGMMWRERRPGDEAWDADWEAIKPLVLYPPEDWVALFKSMLLNHKRDFAVHLDDGGTWLASMEWTDPFVIAFMEYLPLARSNWAGVIISTPVEEWVLKKLHTARGVLHVEVTKDESSTFDPRQGHNWKPRAATCHKVVRYLGRNKPYYPIMFRDHFSAIMPDSFYSWYRPRRDAYTLLATEKMDRALDKRKEKGYASPRDAAVLAQIKESLPKPEEPEKIMTSEERNEHIADANDGSKDFLEVIRAIE